MSEGFRKRDIKNTNDLISLAWHTAVLTRTKEMPELKELLIKEEATREQTETEMFTMMQMLNTAYGGEVVYVD